jgi:hypothetical protein
MAFAHELSWSVSRAGTFEACRRRYYHDYYGSWTGWDRRAPERRQRAYLLKKMTRMPMLAGDCLHRSLQSWFENRQAGVAIERDDLIGKALTMFRDEYKCSRDGRWRQRPSKLTHLAEHHYGEARIDEKTGAAGEYGKRYVERIEQGLGNFFSMPAMAPVREADPRSYLALEEMGTIELFETKLYAIPDFAFRDADGVVRIYDWKTGTPRERDAFQLATYVIYAVERWDVTPEEIVCLDAYLPSGEIKVQTVTEAEIAGVRERIEDSLKAMRELHFDAGLSEGSPELFPMVEAKEGGGSECSMCNYRELCER